MLKLQLLPDIFGICKLDQNTPLPNWALQAPFFSLTKTYDELSLVIQEHYIPSGVPNEGSWRALKIEGPLDFALTGILSSLLTPLAQAHISIFALSTFDTDYILVKEHNLEKTMYVLKQICNING